MSHPSEILNCFIQKQDTVTIPPLTDPQLQSAAFSVIEAAKSQLSELKLADLYSQQLQGEKREMFISEFLYHWAGVDSKPPESMVESVKKSIHSLIHGFLSTHDTDPVALSELLTPLLPYLTNVADVDELSSFLTRSVCSSGWVHEEGAGIVDLATLGTVISEVSIDPEDDERSESMRQLQEMELRDLQRAFDICLNTHQVDEVESNSNENPTSYLSTTRAIFGSEATTAQTQDELDDMDSDLQQTLQPATLANENVVIDQVTDLMNMNESNNVEQPLENHPDKSE